MIREIIKPNSEYLNIKIPKEYIGNQVEVIIFDIKENKKEKKQVQKASLKEFEKISKGITLPKDIKYELKMEDEINNDIL